LVRFVKKKARLLPGLKAGVTAAGRFYVLQRGAAFEEDAVRRVRFLWTNQ
jgi:hypothetical protein